MVQLLSFSIPSSNGNLLMVLGEGRHFKDPHAPLPLAVKLFKPWSQEFEFLKDLLLGERKGSQRRILSPEERFHSFDRLSYYRARESGAEDWTGSDWGGATPWPGLPGMPTFCSYFNRNLM